MDPSGTKPDSDAKKDPAGAPRPFRARLKELVFGRPRDLADSRLFERLSLVAVLAWIGLGADGLSSSSYGPEEAFRTLGQHSYLALAIAAMTAFTVILIAAAYSRIIEQFPHGGGGYVVATKLLGNPVGVVSGSALLVDYVLTIAVSIAAACDALFSFLPLSWQGDKLVVEILLVVGLSILNIRGVRESVLILSPIFALFLVTHLVLILGGIGLHLGRVPEVASSISTGFQGGLATLGVGGMLLLFAHAYSMGGGTYTGIEAVSNGLPIMREPKVRTAKRTMVYMAASLSFTAAGLLICYLLLDVSPEAGKTLNAVLAERFAASIPGGATFVVLTLFTEGALLVVAAQAGFIDGPRVMANMAVDSWMPHRLASLSERLTTRNGILLMGAASLGALVYTRGDVRHLVVMYSINVFLTFSLSMLGMLRFWVGAHGTPKWKRRTALFSLGLALCATILAVTVIEKFREGGWITLAVTGGVVIQCFLVRRHYRSIASKLAELDEVLGELHLRPHSAPGPVNPREPAAVILVAAYSGLGVHTILNAVRNFPGYFKSFVFLSIGIVDSGAFKGEGEIEQLRVRAEETLAKYVELAARMGFSATSRVGIGTDVVDTAEALCLEVQREFPKSVFLSGKLIFRRDHWYHRVLHNQTAFALQKRLQWAGIPMLILPVRVR